ncbi:MAG: hypothetical protein COA78_24235 [Blastopirellula sp.]|nr:MAG: hypothetical protein COA78_24235 [Blastopirellula sp.]
MRETVSKPFRFRWTATGFGVAGLIIVLLFFWFGADELIVESQQINTLPWGWWRGVLYAVLFFLWSWLIKGVAKNRKLKVSKRPLIILIMLYEGLVVLNPLSTLMHWWR